VGRARPSGRGHIGALGVVVVLLSACSSEPCSTEVARRMRRFAEPYTGHWVVAYGDSLTLPDAPTLADRFRVAAVVLDTNRMVAGRACLNTGRLIFSDPRAETLAVRWSGDPGQALVQGWPADLGPFGGLALRWRGRDSLVGSVLFDERMGAQVPSGTTAQFVAGRAP
jgi:hypothetical protein